MDIPQALLAPARDRVGAKEKGGRNKPGSQMTGSIKTRLFLCEDLCLELRLDLELAGWGLKCEAWTSHWDGKGILSPRRGLKLG